MTPFGKAIRKIRIDRGLRLLDLASQLTMSSAYLSSIETGRKPIPDGFVERVSDLLGLSYEDRLLLQRAADQSRLEVSISGLAASQRELVAAFARQVDNLPEDFLQNLRSKILKSSESDSPFRRRRGLVVPPMSTAALRGFADTVRSALQLKERVDFPIVEVLEFILPEVIPNFSLAVLTHPEMGRDEGRVVTGYDAIFLREDVYLAACNGDGRARFTACHELAHFLLHRQVSMARMREDHQPIYQDAEWQADVFAGSILMPTYHARTFYSVDHAAASCGMTRAAAHVMLEKYKKEGAV